MKNKAKKDIAFDMERRRYQKRINLLEKSITQMELEKQMIEQQARETEVKCEKLQDWVERLLSYVDLSEDEMKAVVQKEKNLAGTLDTISMLFSIPRNMILR